MTELSVVMANYNGAKFLRKAISSILSQTYSEFEFIIVDDGSKDDSEDILRGYEKNDSRIKLLFNDKNKGLAASLNVGIDASEGVYVARMDADDECHPDRFARQLDHMRKNNLDLCGTGTKIITNGGLSVCSYAGVKEGDYWEALMSQKAIFPHGSAIFSRKVALELGLYNSEFIYSQDMEFWLRFIDGGYGVGKFPDAMYYFRLQPRGASQAKSKGQMLYTKYLKEKYSGLEPTQSLREINNTIEYLKNNADEPSFVSSRLHYYRNILSYWLNYSSIINR